ncbi:MAG: TniQ family protein, partial [Acholeplasmatales bacterium]|nr:TniQ family protein [Acholeplasmatales bacterium]
MIKYLPKIYPNESFYSYLSRLFCHSGFITSVGFSKEVLIRDKAKVNYEFINELNPSFKELLLSHISYEELLLNHTLFKYHIRFLDNDKKKDAYDYAMTNKSLLFHKLPVPLNKNYYLRYCPLCVKEDRVEYGESYYHIEHLFPFINICPNHCCRLIDTKIKINCELNKTF